MTESARCKVELYKRGDYDLLGLFPKQLEALSVLKNDFTTELLYGGAARGGKSVLMCKWKIYNRFSMAGSVGGLFREELDKLRATTLQTYLSLLKSEGFEEGKDWQYVATEKKIYFSNGSREEIGELGWMPRKDPEFDRLGSFEFTDVGVDESQQTMFKGIQVLKGRMSNLKGEDWQTIPKAMYSCNPSKNWNYQEFYRPKKQGVILKSRDFIAALPSDNPHVDKSFFDNLSTADKVTKERLLYGNFEYDDDDRSLCEYDAILDMFTNDHVMPTGKRYASFDLATKGRDKFVGGWRDGMVVYIDIEEDVSNAKSIERDIRNLKAKRSIPNSRIVADSDGLGDYLSSYLTGIKEFRGGSRAINHLDYANLKAECGWKLSELINRREILVYCSEEAKELLIEEVEASLKMLKVDNDEGKKRLISKEEVKEKIGRSPDRFDFLLMMMDFELEDNEEKLHVTIR